MTYTEQRREKAARLRESRRKLREDARRRRRGPQDPPGTGVREPRPPKVPVLSGGAGTMYPSERYANILRVLPAWKRRRVAEYVDEVYHQGDKLSLYGVRTWKELVQHLVEFESGTSYNIDQSPISDYLTYCRETAEAAGPRPF